MPYGDQTKQCVRAMNQLVINLTVLLALAQSRRQFIVTLGFEKHVCFLKRL